MYQLPLNPAKNAYNTLQNCDTRGLFGSVVRSSVPSPMGEHLILLLNDGRAAMKMVRLARAQGYVTGRDRDSFGRAKWRVCVFAVPGSI